MKKIVFLIVISLISCKTIIIPSSHDGENRVKKSTKKAKKKHLVSEVGGTVFYFIRHAEKKDDNSRNPELSEIGNKRAALYVDLFAKKNIVAIYTTNFNRTIQTVAPLAKNKNLKVTYYEPFKEDFKQLSKKYKGKTVVIVGHSNSTPNSVNQLIDKIKYSQMSEDNYSDIFKVVIYGVQMSDAVLNFEEEIFKIKNPNSKRRSKI